MSPRGASTAPTIRNVLSEYAEERRCTLSPDEHRAYCRVLFFLELCINNYGHRNLADEERALCEHHYHARGDAQRHFFEVFGPAKLLLELDFFANIYVKRDVFTSERIENKALDVVDDLRSWLVARGFVTRAELTASRDVESQRTKLKFRANRAARLIAERAVAVDPVLFADHDYIDTDDHPITRVDPGRFWLRVYRTADPEDIGPLVAPIDATKALEIGWNLSCALARVRGRWQIAGVEGIYPTCF